MGLASIFTALAALAPTSTTVYALASTPKQPPWDALPCLIFELQGERTIAVPFALGGATQAIGVEIQWLLITGIIGTPLGTLYSGAVTALENTLAALSADLFLGGAVIEPVSLPKIEFGHIERQGKVYYGVRLFLQVRYVP